MACPAIITGDQFLLRVINHIDCQAQVLGSYGYQALGEPGSLASLIMAALLTLFIALFGVRMLFGPPPGARDIVYDILKIGIVLTLAFSWPAFRTVIHDVVLNGPAEIANAITTPTLSEPGEPFAARLQSADVAIVRLTELGTGRNTGVQLEGSDTGASFAGTAIQDDSAFGYGRLAFLSGVIASLGLLRLVAALLLAIAPLAAGLLLFEQTRGLFAGWLRGLTLALLGSIGVTVVLALELSIIEPWLADALRVRALGYGIPSAPIELLAITTAFSIVQLAMIWLLAKVAFNRGWISIRLPEINPPPNLLSVGSPAASAPPQAIAQNRAQSISDHVETQVRREQSAGVQRLGYRSLTSSGGAGSSAPPVTATGLPDTSARLGSSYRRTTQRSSRAAIQRDRGK